MKISYQFFRQKSEITAREGSSSYFSMRNLNSLSYSKQVCMVLNPNSRSSVVLGRSFSVTRSVLCVSVLWNTLDTTVSIQRERELGFASENGL